MKSLTELNTFSEQSLAYDDQGTGAQTLADRYQINGLIDTNQQVMKNLEKICSAAGSWLSYDIHEGKWGVVINTTGTSVASFSDTNIIGNVSLSGTGLRDLYNNVKVEFPHRDLRDTADFVTVEIPAGDRNSNEENNTLNLSYDIINEPIQAQLLGFIELKQSRIDKVVKFVSDYSKINLKAGDIIDVTNNQFNFTNKLFRIITITELQDQTGELTVEITALEYDPNVYSITDLYRYTRSDSNGIIAIGSIGIPGTPQVTKFEVDSRPRIVVESTSPTGVVEGIEFWLTNDVLAQEANRSYRLVGLIKPTGGGVYASGTSVRLEYDAVGNSDFLIKTRGVNSTVVGPYSTPSGLIEFRPQQVTDAIGPNTGVVDSTGALLTGLAASYLLNQLSNLVTGNITTSSLLYPVLEGIKNLTGLDLIQSSSGTVVTASQLTVQDEGVNIATSATRLNFIGSAVTASLVNGVVNVVIGGGDVGGGGGVSGITVTSVSPSYGPTSGGTSVVISGTGFTGANLVTFGGTNAASFTVANSTTINAVTPAHSAGLVAVVVGNSSGTNALNNGFTFIQADDGYLEVLDKLPPDRVTLTDPLTGATSDTAPITGSYFISFEGRPFYGALSIGSGNIKLYKSNGTLVETVAAGSCSIFGGTALSIPFATRELGTDYYILMDYGVVSYCGSLSPALTSPTDWNFNTPLYASTPYTTITRGIVENITSSTFSAVSLNVTPAYNSSATFISNFSINWQISSRVGSGSIFVKDWETDVTVLTYTAAQLFAGTTSLASLEPSSKYYITADAGVALNDGYSDCFVAQLNSSLAITKANNLSFTMMPDFNLVSFNVSDTPVGNNKINPQSNVILTFNRPPQFNSFGTISIYKADGTLHQTFTVTDTFTGQKVSEILWISGNSVYLNPTKDFLLDTTYYVQVSNSAVKDFYGRSFGGITDTSTIRFTVDPGPTATTAPITNNNSQIVMTFDREIQSGTGQINYVANGSTVGSTTATDVSVTITTA
jgi:hypothetical protein